MPSPAADITLGIVTKDDDPVIFRAALTAALGEGLDAPAVIVDMSAGNSIREICESFADRVAYVPYPQSRGVSDSRNEVVARVGTRYLLFLDADAVPRPGWARAMRAAFEAASGTAVVGARCVARWASRPPRLFSTQVAGDYLSLFDLGDTPLDVPRIIGTSYAIDLERVPPAPFPLALGFSPGSRLAGEENALCERAIDDGWRVRYEPSAVVEHTIAAERARWSSLMRRAFHAGQEGRRKGRRLDPLPRVLTGRDRIFLALIAPAFLAGLVRGPR